MTEAVAYFRQLTADVPASIDAFSRDVAHILRVRDDDCATCHGDGWYIANGFATVCPQCLPAYSGTPNATPEA